MKIARKRRVLRRLESKGIECLRDEDGLVELRGCDVKVKLVGWWCFDFAESTTCN